MDVDAAGFASNNAYHTNGDTVLTYYVGGEEKTLTIDGDKTPTVSSLAAYTVTYDGNGATTGTVPTDPSSPYEDGSTVTVQAAISQGLSLLSSAGVRVKLPV